MKCVLIAAAALLALVVSSPVEALTQDEAQQRVQSAGCSATVYVRDGWNGFNAYYSPGSNAIVLLGFNHIPETWQTLILWHEVGHCLQFESGQASQLRARGPYELEWDADAYAIRKLAEEGIDGAELNHQIWAALYQQYDYKGDLDDSHGLLTGRIMRGHLNRVYTRLES